MVCVRQRNCIKQLICTNDSWNNSFCWCSIERYSQVTTKYPEKFREMLRGLEELWFRSLSPCSRSSISLHQKHFSIYLCHHTLHFSIGATFRNVLYTSLVNKHKSVQTILYGILSLFVNIRINKWDHEKHQGCLFVLAICMPFPVSTMAHDWCLTITLKDVTYNGRHHHHHQDATAERNKNPTQSHLIQMNVLRLL